MYKISVDQKLYKYETPNERRSWTKIDSEFIIENKNCLNVREISRIIHKSYYATLQKIKLLGLYDMLNK